MAMRKRIKVNNDNNYFGFCELSGKACFKKECCNNASKK